MLLRVFFISNRNASRDYIAHFPSTNIRTLRFRFTPSGILSVLLRTVGKTLGHSTLTTRSNITCCSLHFHLCIIVPGTPNTSRLALSPRFIHNARNRTFYPTIDNAIPHMRKTSNLTRIGPDLGPILTSTRFCGLASYTWPTLLQSIYLDGSTCGI